MITLSDVMVVAGPALGAGIGWLIARKKNNAQVRKTEAETDNMELKNVHEIIEFWRGMVKDLKIEVNHLQLQVSNFRKENTELKGVIANLTVQMEDLRKLMTDNSKSES